ncbi:MAG: acyltransferase family protein [Deltaproteobacteria bacterium]|uniref:acyltransferase family protein n=1 Tax=Desulfobacula sp. TaxID=2593537 RepID=UPI00199DD67F|nr:acyltransferase family protein [Candidatus Desulfobacula maris]MBL6994949.1 acyltransferase family protein [Desulfobacula sp.]
MVKNRIFFLDNLRTFIIFLVVLYHSGAVYESSGIFASFWIVDDPATNKLVDIVNLIVDIFMIMTLFFIAGYVAPLSMKNKNLCTFLKFKFKRLLIPWLIAVFTLIPIYKIIFLYSRNLPQENWMTYFHFNNGVFSQSWLWFLPILFFFLGAIAYNNKIFEAEIKSRKLYYIINSISWIPINIYIFFLIFLFTGQIIVSVTFHKFILYFGFHLSLLCLVYIAIETFRLYFNSKGNIWRILNQNSYGVYIIHVIIIGLIALAMLNTGIPSLCKYVILTTVSYSASNLIVYFYKKNFLSFCIKKQFYYL